MPPPPRTDPARGSEEKLVREPQADAAAAAAPDESAKAAPRRTWTAWLPLLAALVLMPLVAYGVTNYVLLPRLQKSLRATAEPPSASGKEGATDAGAANSSGTHSGQHQSTDLNKLLVNVAGTMGSRYLLTSLTLVGDGADFKDRVKEHDPQLRDMASGLLCAKTIADLEKPGARNLLRGELLAGFNSIMGNSSIAEIYFTEFAIQ